jgi:hypothetical protein
LQKNVSSADVLAPQSALSTLFSITQVPLFNKLENKEIAILTQQSHYLDKQLEKIKQSMRLLQKNQAWQEQDFFDALAEVLRDALDDSKKEKIPESMKLQCFRISMLAALILKNYGYEETFWFKAPENILLNAENHACLIVKRKSGFYGFDAAMGVFKNVYLSPEIVKKIEKGEAVYITLESLNSTQYVERNPAYNLVTLPQRISAHEQQFKKPLFPFHPTGQLCSVFGGNGGYSQSALSHLAEMLMDSDDQQLQKRAELIYTELLRIDPEDPFLQIGLGSVLAHLGFDNSAQKQFEKAMHALPNHEVVLVSLGELYARNNDPIKSIFFLEKGHALNSRNPVSLYWLGFSLKHLGNKTKDRAIFQRAKSFLEEAKKYTEDEKLLKKISIALKEWEGLDQYNRYLDSLNPVTKKAA